MVHMIQISLKHFNSGHLVKTLVNLIQLSRINLIKSNNLRTLLYYLYIKRI